MRGVACVSVDVDVGEALTCLNSAHDPSKATYLNLYASVSVMSYAGGASVGAWARRQNPSGVNSQLVIGWRKARC